MKKFQQSLRVPNHGCVGFIKDTPVNQYGFEIFNSFIPEGQILKASNSFRKHYLVDEFDTSF